MCIIIFRPAGAKVGLVSKQSLVNSARQNSDGFGLMWQDSGKLRIWRAGPGAESSREWISRFLALQKFNIPVAAHARWATHGLVNKTMAHPYWIEPNKSALMHNGILTEPEGTKKNWSDTKGFIECVLKNLPDDWHEQPHLKYLVREATSGSKILIFRRGTFPILIHGDSGIWEDGVWYSNGGYKGYTAASTTPYRAEWEDLDSRDNDAWRKFYDWDGKKYTPKKKDESENVTQKIDDQFQRYIVGRIHSERVTPMYRYEDLVMCEDCLVRDVGPSAPSLLRPLTNPGLRCYFCHVESGSTDVQDAIETGGAA